MLPLNPFSFNLTLKVLDEEFIIVTSIPSAKARLVYWENDTWIEEEYTQGQIKIKTN